MEMLNRAIGDADAFTKMMDRVKSGRDAERSAVINASSEVLEWNAEVARKKGREAGAQVRRQGEAMNQLPPEQRKVHDAVVKELIARGKLVEAGFAAMRLMVISPDASDIEVREMRMAYMSGAQHVFASIMSCFDPGSEATDNDVNRMQKIAEELEGICEELKLRAAPTSGSH